VDSLVIANWCLGEASLSSIAPQIQRSQMILVEVQLLKPINKAGWMIFSKYFFNINT